MDPGTTGLEASVGSTVAIVRWPRDRDRRAELAALGIPRLLVLDAGAPLPDLDDDEDWVRAPVDERDVAARVAALRRRAGTVRLEGSALRTSRGTATLSPAEARVARALLAAAGALVTRPTLESALTGPGAGAGAAEGVRAGDDSGSFSGAGAMGAGAGAGAGGTGGRGGRGVSARAVDDIVYRLRRRLRPLGLDVFAARSRGFTLGPRLDWPVEGAELL